jgi:hypothetical protein
MNDTPTPETDAERKSVIVHHPGDAAAEQMAQCARKLERERNTARSIAEANGILAHSAAREAAELREQIAAERALADRLADVCIQLMAVVNTDGRQEICEACASGVSALTSWREARK